MLTHEVHKNSVVVKLSGELDHYSAGAIRTELDELIADPRIKQLVLDLNDLCFMDSSGIGMLIGRYKVMSRKGGSVAVRRANPHVDRIFEMAGLYQIIEKLA